MSNNSKRIKLNLNNSDTHFKINLSQDTEELSVLSLKITQKDIYNSFNSDFGVVVGRVNGNDNIGIPNARISLFIPISEEDKNNPDIVALYPYETPRDINKFNKRYNLLPRTSILDENGNYKPKQPFGSFPNKVEISVDETQLEIYEKYYKYTTITNDSGDYMLFGVPTGIQTVHMSVDITDIGPYSMSPIEMIQNLGYSENLFSEDGFSIIEQKRLEDLPNIETQEIGVNVIPFWGDKENFEIGITRQDFNIRAQIRSSTIVFGTIGTMGEPCVIGTPDISYDGDDRNNSSFYFLSNESNNEINMDIRTLRGSNDLNIKVFTYPNYINKSDIDKDLTGTTFTDINDYKNNSLINTRTDIVELDESEYYYYVNNGFFVLVINCNRDRRITNEQGELVPIDEDSEKGVFTNFLGMVLIDYNDNEAELPITQNHNGDTYYGGDKAYNTRGILKIPQSEYSLRNVSDEDNPEDSEFDRYMESEKWKKKYFSLGIGKYYSVSGFFPTTYIKNDWLTNTLEDPDNKLILPDNEPDSGEQYEREVCLIGGFIFRTAGLDLIDNYIFKSDVFNYSGETINYTGGTAPTTDGGFDSISSGETQYKTYNYEFPYNKIAYKNIKTDNGFLYGLEQRYFGAQWVNMFILIPQFSYARDYTTYGEERDLMVSKMIFGDYTQNRNSWFLEHRTDIQQHVLGDIYTPKNIIRGDTFKTDIIEIPESHLNILSNIDSRSIHLKKLVDNNIIDSSDTIYYNHDTNNSNGSYNDYNGAYVPLYDEGPYIFKGFYENDAIKTLYNLNFI
jgi:hypothetical protein